MVTLAIGAELNVSGAESSLVFNHHIVDGNHSASLRETTPPADDVSRFPAPGTTFTTRGELNERRMLLPATLQRFAATIVLDSSVFDIPPAGRGPALIRTTGLSAARNSLKRQKSLVDRATPSEKRGWARSMTFAPQAVADLAKTEFSNGTIARQAGLRASLVPDLFHLVSTPAFGANSPRFRIEPFAGAPDRAGLGYQSPDTLTSSSVARLESAIENQDWDIPPRAAAANPSTVIPLSATTEELGTAGAALGNPTRPSAALSSGLLANNLTFGANGARLSGNGTIAGDVILDTNLGIAPGNSPGLLTVAGGLTWSQGGFFELEIQDTAGAPGTGWDSIHVNGILQFTATLGEPFTLHLSSLTDSGASGNISNFLASRPYALQVLTATGGINGFNPSAVRITTTGFTNALDGGSFALLASGDELMLTFTPVPEPSTWALMLTGASVLALKFMRRRRRA